MPKQAPKDLALCPYQKFEVERWDRRKIKNAPYNPRTITKDAQKRLQAKIKKRGLLQAVTVNRVTNNLVGGHKRLAILDALMGTSAYLLDVCVVKLTPQQEREENIAFNNPALQGDWDLAALADVLPDLDIEETGFDNVGLEALLGEQGEGTRAALAWAASSSDGTTFPRCSIRRRCASGQIRARRRGCPYARWRAYGSAG